MDEAFIKKTIVELRVAQGDEEAVRIAIVKFLQQGMEGGDALDQLILMLVSGPDGILRRALLSPPEQQRVIDLIRGCTLAEIAGYG